MTKPSISSCPASPIQTGASSRFTFSRRKQKRQSGNAVIFILIAVALFAALIYTFTRSAQTGQGNLSAGQAKFAAMEIIDHSTSIERSLDRLLQRGCSIDELSMEKAPSRTTSYQWHNSDAPTDNHCHLYEPEGANLPDEQSPTGFGTTAYWTYSTHMQFCGAGTGNVCYHGIAVYLHGLSDQVCREINKQLNNGLDLPSSSMGDQNWCYNPSNAAACGVHYSSWGWASCSTFGIPASPTCLPVSGCFKYTLKGHNSFYKYVYLTP